MTGSKRRPAATAARPGAGDHRGHDVNVTDHVGQPGIVVHRVSRVPADTPARHGWPLSAAPGARSLRGGGPGRWVLLLVLMLLVAGGLATPAVALDGRVNINTATVEELQTLPFIGEVRARALLEHRRQHGPFAEFDELLASPAIGPRTLEAIRPYLSLAEPSTQSRAAGPAAEPARTIQVRRLIVTRPGEIKLLCDDEYYPSLLQLLQSAGRRVEVAMFVFRATGAAGNRPTIIAESLVDASQRGVEVRVILEHSAYDESLTREHRRLAGILREGGVTVRFGPRDTTTHNKIVLIDDRFTLLGSHNLTHSALSFNHECSLLIDNEDLVARLRAYLRRLPAS